MGTGQIDVLGFTQAERDEVCWAICELAKDHMEKRKVCKMELYVQQIHLQDEDLVEIPTDRIRFIMVHPFLEKKISRTDVGFSFKKEHKGSQKDLIQATFPLVRFHPSREDSHADFLIFPELSVTREALEVIEDAMQESIWPQNSIVMGGLECISGKEFKNLLDNSDNSEEINRLPSDIASFNVNTSFIYIKTNEKELRKYYQPKMSSSPPEQGLQNQYRGSYLLLFRTKSVVFTQIICFDAIARSRNRFETMADSILKGLKPYGSTSRPLRIDICFVLQHNNNPNHCCFRKFTKDLLEKGGRELIIDTVVFVNSTANKLGCSERYGKSRFQFLTEKYQVPKKNAIHIPETFSLKKEESIKYAQFREDGPCVHTFVYIPPPAIGASTEDDRYPFDRAFMHEISNDGSIGEGKPINGLRKKVFDFLPNDLPDIDVLKRRWVADQCNRIDGLNSELKRKFEEIRNKLVTERLQLNRLKEITDLLFLGYDEEGSRGRIKNPDYWRDNYEGEGIKDLASGLTIFKILGDIALQDSSLSKAHTALFRNDKMDFYLALIDDPTDGSLIEKLRIRYNDDYLNDIKWGDIDWSKNTLLLLFTGNRSFPTDNEVVCLNKFTNPNGAPVIPVDSVQGERTRFDSAKSLSGSVFYCGLDNLRGDLARPCNEIIPKWRKKLEPLGS